MRNLTGYLKKILYLFSPLFLFIIFLNSTFANEGFKIYTAFEHTLTESSIDSQVLIQIQSDSPRVLSYYTASIPIKDLNTECLNYKTGQPVECTLYHRGSVTDVLFNLKNSVVKPDAPMEILLKYSTSSTTSNTYTMPSQISDTTTNSILIRYPKEMGEPLWSSDPIQNIKASGENLEIIINKPSYSSISLLFGENVTYRFDISKVFSNSLEGENQTFEVYVPADTSNQIVIWDEISPQPNTTLKDEDGNYIFKYIVAPNETLDCKISGYIKKTETTQEEVSNSFLTETTGYWSITNNTEFKRVNTYLKKKGLKIEDNFDDINDIDDNQKELFYKYIYQYVIERLNYESNISLGITNETRLGANALTEASNESSTIDYADFLIAILRKYKVPSRLIIGYISNITGYTADGFYHHWVEYFDTTTNKWITVDPFLEEYFEKPLSGSSFYDHIVILKRGKSAVSPKMSFFQDNDFVVRSDTQENVKAEFDVNSQISFEEYKITNRYLKGYIYVSNVGNTAISSYKILKSNISNIQRYMDPVNNLQSQIILPKQNSTLQLNIPTEKVNSKNIFINITYENSNSQKKEMILENELEEIVPGYLILIAKILSLIIFSAITFLIYFLVKKFIKRKNG
jgi:hypothetical protein